MPGPFSNQVAGVVLAAGVAARMGRTKQLLDVGGRGLLARVLHEVLQSRVGLVVLVLGHRAREIRTLLAEEEGLVSEQALRLQIVENKQYASGQASSIQCGISVLDPEAAGALFIMGDQIGLKRRVIDRIHDRARQADHPPVVQPRYGGRSAGPLFWSRKYFPRLMTLSGDKGGRVLLPSLSLEEIAVLDFEAEDYPWDIDTPEDYQRWRFK